jgi:hypothetical protein
MPLYTFRCAFGHVTERLAPMNAPFWLCSCGEAAKRQAVYPITTGLKDWGGDFHMPSDVRDAIEESNGYKAEAVAAMNEAVENGWKARS